MQTCGFFFLSWDVQIVNSGAVQNEGNKERLLGQLGSDKLKRDGVDDEEVGVSTSLGIVGVCRLKKGSAGFFVSLCV